MKKCICLSIIILSGMTYKAFARTINYDKNTIAGIFSLAMPIDKNLYMNANYSYYYNLDYSKSENDQEISDDYSKNYLQEFSVGPSFFNGRLLIFNHTIQALYMLQKWDTLELDKSAGFLRHSAVLNNRFWFPYSRSCFLLSGLYANIKLWNFFKVDSNGIKLDNELWHTYTIGMNIHIYRIRLTVDDELFFNMTPSNNATPGGKKAFIGHSFRIGMFIAILKNTGLGCYYSYTSKNGTYEDASTAETYNTRLKENKFSFVWSIYLDSDSHNNEKK